MDCLLIIKGCTMNIDESIVLKKALVVDDDPSSLLIMEHVLEKYDVNVITANNGQEAIERLKTDKDFDIIITDVIMPVMNGVDLCSHLNHSFPILVISSDESVEEMDEIAEFSDAYIDKHRTKEFLLKASKAAIQRWQDGNHHLLKSA